MSYATNTFNKTMKENMKQEMFNLSKHNIDKDMHYMHLDTIKALNELYKTLKETTNTDTELTANCSAALNFLVRSFVPVLPQTPTIENDK